jgi:Kdo2-lipid IVA lauroyltransferase/acyltransferase
MDRAVEFDPTPRNWRQDLRFRLEYVGIRVVAAIISALPLAIASGLSGVVWRQLAPWLPRHKRADANLARAMPELSPAERRRILLSMWENLGRTFGEFFHLPDLLKDGRLEIENVDALAAAAHTGLVACAPHMGNWETLGPYAAQQGFPIAGIYRELANPLVEAFVRRLRTPYYSGGLYPKTAGSARRLVKQARSGGIVAFLADQRDGRGVPSPFFGQTAFSTPFPAFVARSVGLPLFAVRVLRRAGPRFSLKIEEVPVPNSGDREADVRAATAALQTRFEAFIREAPEQWMWAHNRWG